MTVAAVAGGVNGTEKCMSSVVLHSRTNETFAQAAAKLLDGLWAALHEGACPADVRSLLSTLVSPWGSNPIPASPAWPSDIGADHSPFEFSVALTPGAPELRVVVEAQGNGPGFRATREAGLRLNESLARRGADLRRLTRVQDLFLPKVRDARFALWHAVALAEGPLRAKAYLNPQIHGAGQACSLMKSAFERLDMDSAWATVASALPARPLRGEEIRYFAVDLERSTKARVKIYLYLENATASDLEGLAALRPGYVRGEVTEFCRAMLRSTGPYALRPPCVYLAFTGSEAIPSDVTVQIPIGHHTSDDRVARDRVRAYLLSRGLDTRAYERALNVVAIRPLQSGNGLHTYVSLRAGRTPARVTLYFAAGVYGVRTPLSGPQRVRSRVGVETDVVDDQAMSLGDH
jgi:DMATS type aromatic prenyltransferase